MKIIGRAAIEAQLDKDAVINAVREAFVAHSSNDIHSPLPMHMSYMNSAGALVGDCHVKAAHSGHHPVIAIKVAVGFYENHLRGMPVNNGLVILLSRETGAPVALLQEEGLLTTCRTAAAGAIAASLVATRPTDVIGIVGTGTQAFEQAVWSTHLLGLKNVIVYGRSTEKANVLVDKLRATGLAVDRAGSVAELCAACRIVITTTPASDPVIQSSDIVAADIHLVAVGADTYGKQELDANILARADVIVVDDEAQCLDHGEVAAAAKAGMIDSDQLISLGTALLSGLTIDKGVSVVDLTGLGAQDLAIASLIT